MIGADAGKTTGRAILIGMLAIVLFAFGRMAWRLYRGDIEAEAGGSYGRQMIEMMNEHPKDRPDSEPRGDK